MYTIKEIFYSLQGEGFYTGRPAVFCRFSGCNLSCEWCDTDFQGTNGPRGGQYKTAQRLAYAIDAMSNNCRFVVFTGGEPLLQLDMPLCNEMHDLGFEVAAETNGTVEACTGINWLTMSPKAGVETVLKHGDELKLVFPQQDMYPDCWADNHFGHFYLQPMDGPDITTNTQRAIDYCLKHPQWHLSTQVHKTIGVK